MRHKLGYKSAWPAVKVSPLPLCSHTTKLNRFPLFLSFSTGERCIEVGNKASKALLANAGVCDQQNVADEMIDLAKSLHHNSAELVTLAQEYAHASHAVSGSCTTTPKNSELTAASAKTTAKKGKAVVGASAKHKAQHKSAQHKSGVRAKEDGEEEEESSEEEEGEGNGNGNQLPGSTTVCVSFLFLPFIKLTMHGGTERRPLITVPTPQLPQLLHLQSIS